MAPVPPTVSPSRRRLGSARLSWDLSFYHNLVLKRDYGVNTEKIKEYFPLDHVVAVTMETYEELLGLTFTEIPQGQFDTWFEGVRLFHVKYSRA